MSVIVSKRKGAGDIQMFSDVSKNKKSELRTVKIC